MNSFLLLVLFFVLWKYWCSDNHNSSGFSLLRYLEGRVLVLYPSPSLPLPNLVCPDKLTVSMLSEHITIGKLPSSHIVSGFVIVLCATDRFISLCAHFTTSVSSPISLSKLESSPVKK